MKKQISGAFLFFLCAPVLAFSQSAYTVSGRILSGESLAVMNAIVQVADSIAVGLTDSSGRFQLKLTGGWNEISVSATGYSSDTIQLHVSRDTSVEIRIKSSMLLSGVIVTGNKQIQGARHTADGAITLNNESINPLPAFLGENDPVRAVQMQPGIQNGSEGAMGIFIRGGGPDQTLMLLDGSPVYNPAHLDGFLSVFNGDAIDSISIYKDLYPAQYFSRLGAVVDIKTQEGDTGKITGSISVGVLTSRFHLDGSLTKNKKLTFALSARGCYAGLFMAPLSKAQFAGSGSAGSLWYYFADVNVGLLYRFSAKTQLQINFFTNSDFYHFQQNNKDSNQAFSEQNYVEQNYKWSNYVASIHLLQTINGRWKITHQFSFSRYSLSSYEENNYSETYAANSSNDFYSNYVFNTSVWLDDFGWHTDAQYTTQKNTLTTGAGLTGMLFKTGGGTFDIDNTTNGNLYYQLNGLQQQSLASFIYAEDEFRAGKRWVITGEARAGTYTVTGKTFLSLLPGLSAVYNPTGKLYLRASGCGVSQNMHLLTTSSSNILNDFWVPATATAKPETGWNFSSGLTQKLPLNFEWSANGFYRLMNNVIDYTQATNDYAVYESWESQVTTGGKGKSYGGEFYLARSTGVFTGSIAYTLAWSDRQFATLNNGNYFSYQYDRRHNLTAQLAAKIGKHIELGTSFVYGSGNMITLPSLTYQTFGSISSYFQAVQSNTPTPGSDIINVYDGRNNYRLPSYQHLDVSVTYRKKTGNLEHIFNFSVYNVYNHFNQFSIYPVIQANADGTRNIVYKQISLLPVIPSAVYTLKFR